LSEPGGAGTEIPEPLPSPWTRWRWVIGLALLGAASAGGGVYWQRRKGPFLQGQLLALSGPAELPLPLPWTLASKRRRRVTLGHNATWPAWRLPGWDGQAYLEVGGSGTVLLRIVQGTAQINGEPVRKQVRLSDGDTITCGDYRLRYENLLA